MTLLFLSAVLLLTTPVTAPDSLVAPDTLAVADTACPTRVSITPAFNLDFRDSFLEHRHINVWGVNAGIEYGAKRHQLTLGYYWLNYATYQRLIDWRRDAARLINLDSYTRTDLWFMSLQYWWNLTNNQHWMISVPVEIGGGVAYAMPRELQKDVQIDRTKRDFFVPVQAGAYVQWKATRWVGLSGQIGYRYSVFQSDIDQHFNGVYYSVGVTIYPALVTDLWRWGTKKDRISPLHPPRPRKSTASPTKRP